MSPDKASVIAQMANDIQSRGANITIKQAVGRALALYRESEKQIGVAYRLNSHCLTCGHDSPGHDTGCANARPR